MEWVETTGKSIEEAKDAALDQLGVDEDDAEFMIVAEPKLGLFGRVRQEARVRARVKPTKPRPKDEARDRRRRQRRGDGGGDKAERTEKAPRAERPAAASAGPAAPASSSAEGSASGGASGGSNRSKRRRGGGGGASAGGSAPAAAAPAAPIPVEDAIAEAAAELAVEPADQQERAAASATVPSASRRKPARRPAQDDDNDDRLIDEGEAMTDVAMAEQSAVAEQFLAGLLAAFGSEASIDVRDIDEETIEVAVTGNDLGLLIGPKGATLTAVQDLVRTAVQRKTGARNGRILVDVAGYRQKRKVALERFAKQVAADVIASGSRRLLEPMGPADRKIVHDTVNDIEGVSTTSEGEEPRRRVVILPA